MSVHESFPQVRASATFSFSCRSQSRYYSHAAVHRSLSRSDHDAFETRSDERRFRERQRLLHTTKSMVSQVNRRLAATERAEHSQENRRVDADQYLRDHDRDHHDPVHTVRAVREREHRVKTERRCSADF